MQKEEILKIDSAIANELEKIRNYFKNLNRDNVVSKELSMRINNELPRKIDYLDGVIRTTTISLLEADAMNTIKTWEAVDKNKYYDSEIEKKISFQIKSKQFVNYKSNLIRNSFWSMVIFFSSLTIIIGYNLDINILLLSLISVIFIIVSKYIIQKMLIPYEKRKIIQYLNKYLFEISSNYHNQVSVISNEYYTMFNKIAKKVRKE